ncbi:MAG: hypothetical protein HFI77_01685 [Lachnospiraceae bacterium]|jgi:hypothetical protein|nr:hypothetical protein [Lachnospiraceae bacterium]MDE6904632.1 hypothetical protein [Lachnospiraceae bacterium]
MKEEMKLPNKFQFLSKEEMRTVTGGGKKDGIDEMRKFWEKVLKKRK